MASLPVLLLLALNGLTLTAFALDKGLARGAARRVPERVLLGLALLGGTPGAYAGRRLFRHKTRKQPFARRLHAIAFIQLAGIAGAAWLRS